MEKQRPRRRVLIVDDTPRIYRKIRSLLEAESFECVDRVENLEGAKKELEAASKSRLWFSFILIDLDLSQAGEPWNGLHVYEHLYRDFPNETYIVYSRHDADSFRDEINRVAFRDVQLLLLDEIFTQKTLSLALARVTTSAPTNTVFLVHGRHAKKVSRLTNVLKKNFGLDIVDMEKAREAVVSGPGYIFEIVLRGIQMSHATVVLFTDDESTSLNPKLVQKGERRNVRRARPNVYIEAGYAMGVRPKRTIFVEWMDEPNQYVGPSDFDGIHTLQFRDTPQGYRALQQRLEAARCTLVMK